MYNVYFSQRSTTVEVVEGAERFLTHTVKPPIPAPAPFCFPREARYCLLYSISNYVTKFCCTSFVSVTCSVNVRCVSTSASCSFKAFITSSNSDLCLKTSRNLGICALELVAT